MEIKGGLGAGLDVDLPASVRGALQHTAIGDLVAGISDVPLYEKMCSVYKRQQSIPANALCGAG